MRCGIARHLTHWMAGTALLLALTSLIIWQPWPLMIGIFLGIIALVERRAVPNIANALLAYDTTMPATGTVSITITRWDMDDHYHAIVHQAGQSEWAYDFIPQGWKPVADVHPARIWRLEPGGPPALCAVSAGLLIPRNLPRQIGQ